MDYYEIGQRIRQARKKVGLSQEGLAEQIGISTTHMSHIETGNTKLSLPVLVALSRTLHVRTDEFLNPSAGSDPEGDIASVVRFLETCSPQQIAIIRDTVQTLKKSMDRNL